MKGRPILFSAPMVRAILEGRKTQTRLAVTKLNSKVGCWKWEDLRWDREPLYVDGSRSDRQYLHVPAQPDWAGDYEGIVDRVYPRMIVGDLLWVRESWSPDRPGSKLVHYRADGWDYSDCPQSGWKPSIYMPRWASRITLEVTGVRCERLQEISEEDARAEGAMFFNGGEVNHSGWRHDYKDVYRSARGSFYSLWNSINGKRAPWESNPWVWVYKFKRVGC